MKLTHLNTNYILWGTLMNSHSAEVIQITGQIDFDRLKEAIYIAVEKQPILNCCIRRRMFHYYWHPLPKNAPISIEHCDYSNLPDEEIRRSTASHTWHRQADHTNERLIRFYLIDAGNDISYLQSVSHHAAADAQSGFILFKDIANIYTALTKSTPVDRRKHQLRSRDVGRQFLSKFSFSERQGIIFRGIKAFFRKPNFKVCGINAHGDESTNNRSIYTDSLPDDLLKKLKVAARHHGVSLHVLFIFAMINFRTRFDGVDNRIGFQLLDVLTLRQFSDEDVSMAYDAFSINHIKDFDIGKKDVALISDISSYINELKDGKIFEDWYQQKIWVSAFMLMPRWLGKKYVKAILNSKLKSNMTISNLGIFNFDSYEFGDAEVTDFFSYPNVGGPLKLGFFFCTFRGSLKLTVVYDPSCFGVSAKNSIVEPFVEELNRIFVEVREANGFRTPYEGGLVEAVR